jgi:hypothetical protein
MWHLSALRTLHRPNYTVFTPRAFLSRWRIQGVDSMKKINVVALIAFWISGCTFDGSNGSEGEDNSAAQEPGALTPHCVSQISSNDVSCYSSFREAIAFATGGMIVDAPEANVALVDESFARRIDALSVTINAGVVIGIDYEDAKWTGSTLTWTANIGCDGNIGFADFEAFSMPSGWNDEITSFRSFSNCQTVLFEHNGFFGATTQKAVDLSFGGSAMDDRASSIRWF